MLSLFALFRRIAEPTLFLSLFLPPTEISLFWGTSTAITSSGTQKTLPNPVVRKYSIGSSPLTSFPSISLTYLLFSIAPLEVAPPLTIPLIPPLVLFCSLEVLQNLGSNHLSILRTVSFYSFFRRNERPQPFNFQKTLWDDFAFYYDSHCPSAEEYLSLFFFLCGCSLYSSDTECSQIFHYFWRHQTPT